MPLKKNYIILILLIINSLISYSVNSGRDSVFFQKYRQPQNPTLFLFTAGYRMPINNNSILNSGHGFYFEGGINPGRLFSKNLTLGLYAGWALMDRCWSTSFDQNFASDYAAAIKKDQNFSGLDSAVIYSSVDLIKNTKGDAITLPGCDMKSFHNYSLYYGIIIKLPYKYVPIIKVYAGTTRSYYLGDDNIATKHKDFNAFQLRRKMIGCELVIFKGVQNLFRKQKLDSNKYAGALSIYYESCNFYNSTLYFYDGVESTNIPLKKYTSETFLRKYKNEVSWGFKLAFNII